MKKFTSPIGVRSVALLPVDLRCEYEVNPVGVGSEVPRLMWKLVAVEGAERGLLQQAYEIEAASTREGLDEGAADLWRSGRVESDQSVGVEYGGAALRSLQEVWWRVRVWDGAGEVSPWSEPARWTMGLRHGDWRAQWISRPWEGPERQSRVGYVTRPTRERTGQTGAAVIFDLGEETTLERVVLYPADPFFGNAGNGSPANRQGIRGPGWAFPHGWVLEGAGAMDFGDAVVVAEGEWDGEGFDRDEPVVLEVAGGVGAMRYYRLRFVRSGAVRFEENGLLEKMRPLLEVVEPPLDVQEKAGIFYCSALAEVELWSGGRNVARVSEVKAVGGVELPGLGFGVACLTDGEHEGVEGLPLVMQLLPVPYFRKGFTVRGEVKRALVTYTAVGLCALELNGEPVGEECSIEPGWTFTRKWYDREPGWVMVRTREVTGLLCAGENRVGAMLGDGWQRNRGFVAWNGRNHCKGHRTALRVQLDIEYADGRREVVGSGPDWELYTEGPWRSVSMFDGVRYDARYAVENWSQVGGSGEGWGKAESAEGVDGLECVPMVGPVVGVVAKLAVVQESEPKPGIYVMDFGQNTAGVCHVTLRGPAGRRVRIRYAQELREDGTLMLANLGNAWKNSDDYILDGKGPLQIAGRFTFHGFRYVQVEGLGAREELEAIEAWVLADQMERVGVLESGDERLNRLWRNLDWTVLSVSKSVVMDCVGRDERRGWMADGIGNLATHAYFYDFSNLAHKVLRDIRYEQRPNGMFDPVAPWGCVVDNYAAGWCDSGVTAAANVLACYGDTREMEEHYLAMERFMEGLVKKFPEGIVGDDGGLFWGDWLSFFMTHWEPTGEGPVLARQPSREVFGTAWWYVTTRRMAAIARVLGRSEWAERWEEQAEWIREQFNRHLIGPNGIVGEGTVSMICDTTGRASPADAAGMPPRGGQGEIALALAMGLLEGRHEREEQAMHDLLEAIRGYRGHLATGIHCTSRLLMALTDRGRHALAWELAMQPTYPSFGYMVEQGATTIWESWDHLMPGQEQHPRHGINDATHPGLSGVGEWIMGRVAGIRPMVEHPGFRRFQIEPHAEAGPGWVRARLLTVRGMVESAWWRLEDGRYRWEIVIPPNAEGEIVLPVESGVLLESGQPIEAVAGITKVSDLEGGGCKLLCGSGRYCFTNPKKSPEGKRVA